MPTELSSFSENPFADGHDPRFLYPSRSHGEAVAHLRRALESREPFALLTGLPGVGKTVAVETALAEAGRHTRVTVVASPALTREEFLARVLAGFVPGADAPTSPARSADGLEARLRAVTASGHAAVLVVEEAQELGLPLLDDLRLYSNLEADGHALLHIVLAGQPVLEETLSDPGCEALRRRVAAGHRLEPLSAAETEEYVRHRVAVAGDAGRPRFTAEACRALHRLTHGIPREIGRLASEALALANTAGEDDITAGHVTFAVMMLGFHSAAAGQPLADEPEPVAEESVEAVPASDEYPQPVECAVADAVPAVTHVEPIPASLAEEPVARADAQEIPAVESHRDFILEVQTAPPAPRPAGCPREALPGGRSPRAGRRLSRTAAWTTVALLLVVAGGFALARSTRGRVQPPATATVAVATPAGEPAAARPASVSPKRPSPAPARAGTVPARSPAPAVAAATADAKRAPATAERSYGVEVATFLSEARAQAECDRLAAAIQLPCRVVPSDEDVYAVVVGPVSGAKEATRLSVDLAQRGLVGEARVVRWAASGGKRR